MTNIAKTWSPYMTYVCTLRDIQRWFDKNGPRAFYDGVSWELKYTRLCSGRYEVKFIKHQPENGRGRTRSEAAQVGPGTNGPA